MSSVELHSPVHVQTCTRADSQLHAACIFLSLGALLHLQIVTEVCLVPCTAEAQIVRAAAEEQEDSLAAHVLMSLLEGGTFNSDGEVEDPDYSPQVLHQLPHNTVNSFAVDMPTQNYSWLLPPPRCSSAAQLSSSRDAAMTVCLCYSWQLS